MHISNSSPSSNEAISYTASQLPSKPVDVAAATTLFAEHIGTHSAERVKDILHDKIDQDPLFMAGIGIRSLGYTFLLLQMYSELEVELMKSANTQSELNVRLYEAMKDLEYKIGAEILDSGMAKGLSQIGGAVSSLAGAGVAAFQRRSITKAHEAQHSNTYIKATPTNQNPLAAPAGSAATGHVAGAQPQAASAAQPIAAQPAVAPAGVAHVAGNVAAPPAATNTTAIPKGKTKAELDMELTEKLKGVGEIATMFGQSGNQIARGIGETCAAYNDQASKEDEGLKHLVQMVISSVDSQKSRLQQQYEEASKKMEEAIQAYNAAMNASH